MGKDPSANRSDSIDRYPLVRESVDADVAREAIELWLARNDRVVASIRQSETDDPASLIYFSGAIRDIFGRSSEELGEVLRGADFARFLLGKQTARASRSLPDFGIDTAESLLQLVSVEVENDGFYPGSTMPPEKAFGLTTRLAKYADQMEGEQYRTGEVFWNAVNEAGAEEPDGSLPYFLAGVQIAVLGIGKAIEDAANFAKDMQTQTP